MSALGQKQTCAVQKACPLYPRKRTRAVQLGMSAKCQKRTWLIHYSPTNSRSFFTVWAASLASSVVSTVISPVRL